MDPKAETLSGQLLRLDRINMNFLVWSVIRWPCRKESSGGGKNICQRSEGFTSMVGSRVTWKDTVHTHVHTASVVKSNSEIVWVKGIRAFFVLFLATFSKCEVIFLNV